MTHQTISFSGALPRLFQTIWCTRILNTVPITAPPQTDIIIRFLKQCEQDQIDALSPSSIIRYLKLMAKQGKLGHEKNQNPGFGYRMIHYYWRI